MKSILLILAISGVAYGFLSRRRMGPPSPGAADPRAKEPIMGTITQKVDHFNPTDERTWEMRFAANDQFFTPGSPMFVYIGGESSIDPGCIQFGIVFDMAENHTSYMFATEHRYYGESQPRRDLSSENLKYLSADQALEDLAYFIETKKAEIAGLKSSKVVVVGGSYAGSLATWMRIKYPHLVDIGYSSSGPLRAVADFFEYFEVVNDNLALASPQCVTTIAEGIAEIESKLQTPDGIHEIPKLFRTCQPTLDISEPNRSYFFNYIAGIFAVLVQYADPGSLNDACDTLIHSPGNSLQKLATYINTNSGDCIDSYSDFIKLCSDPTATNANRAWLYQTCTEFGFYQTSTSHKQPFGQNFALSLDIQQCWDIYGPEFTSDVLNAGINRTNLVYGSVAPVTTNLVSVHGTGDPWHTLGLTHDLNPLAPVVIINGTSHCADLSYSDTPELKDAQTRVKNYIALCLFDWSSNSGS